METTSQQDYQNLDHLHAESPKRVHTPFSSRPTSSHPTPEEVTNPFWSRLVTSFVVVAVLAVIACASVYIVMTNGTEEVSATVMETKDLSVGHKAEEEVPEQPQVSDAAVREMLREYWAQLSESEREAISATNSFPVDLTEETRPADSPEPEQSAEVAGTVDQPRRNLLGGVLGWVGGLFGRGKAEEGEFELAIPKDTLDKISNHVERLAGMLDSTASDSAVTELQTVLAEVRESDSAQSLLAAMAKLQSSIGNIQDDVQSAVANLTQQTDATSRQLGDRFAAHADNTADAISSLWVQIQQDVARSASTLFESLGSDVQTTLGATLSQQNEAGAVDVNQLKQQVGEGLQKMWADVQSQATTLAQNVGDRALATQDGLLESDKRLVKEVESAVANLAAAANAKVDAGVNQLADQVPESTTISEAVQHLREQFKDSLNEAQVRVTRRAEQELHTMLSDLMKRITDSLEPSPSPAPQQQPNTKSKTKAPAPK